MADEILIFIFLTGLIFFIAGLFIGYQMAKGDIDQLKRECNVAGDEFNEIYKDLPGS